MSFIGNVKILGTMKKFPAGAMVIPLLIGCTINTFFPDSLLIGGFTSGLFKNGIPTLIGLYLFCSGATIDVKAAGSTVYKGVILTVLKFFVAECNLRGSRIHGASSSRSDRCGYKL